jgi:hypothetical protein
MMHAPSRTASGSGRAWFALTVAGALHVLDEATTSFLSIYNPTVTGMRARFARFPMPPRNAFWLRPLAWFYALIMFFFGMGHTVFTILGRTVPTITFPRPRARILLVAFSLRWIGVADGTAVEDCIGERMPGA